MQKNPIKIINNININHPYEFHDEWLKPNILSTSQNNIIIINSNHITSRTRFKAKDNCLITEIYIFSFWNTNKIVYYSVILLENLFKFLLNNYLIFWIYLFSFWSIYKIIYCPNSDFSKIYCNFRTFICPALQNRLIDLDWDI